MSDTKPLRPMLAAIVKEKDLATLTYPLLAQPKYDGIRCLITREGAVSRKLLPIPNDYIRSLLGAGHPPALLGCDGELIAGPTYNETASAVMSKDGAPSFRYHVFDRWDRPERNYMLRMTDVMIEIGGFFPCEPVPTTLCKDADDVLAKFSDMRWLLGGQYDGLILRDPSSPYKYGRSTLRQQYLLKFKEFQDAEAVITGYEEMMHNSNIDVRDALGYAKRSHDSEGKVGAGILGSLKVQHGLMTFSIGTGFTAVDRDVLWTLRRDLIGRIVKYRYQSGGGYEAPRFPSFLGFRED